MGAQALMAGAQMVAVEEEQADRLEQAEMAVERVVVQQEQEGILTLI
jgi:hypothetical protein